MGTDLPSTAPLRGAIVRGFRKIVVIRSRLLWCRALAGDLHAGRESTRAGSSASTPRRPTAQLEANDRPDGRCAVELPPLDNVEAGRLEHRQSPVVGIRRGDLLALRVDGVG